MFFEYILYHPWNTPSISRPNESPIVQSKFEVLYRKDYLVILISFNFWGRSVNCWSSVFCPFIDRSYLCNKTFLRHSFCIISDPLEKLSSEITKFFKFSEIEFLLTVRVMKLSFGVQRSLQKCHPWFTTKKHVLSKKTCFEQGYAQGKLF